ncbi:hypothetical protein NSU_2888 [Novosphingobium pentaromativorans US6-1]|uniref:Uncharacterized protein n=1 Tax=Novosphingobium pentaromativorans US6-1 TaxID=1088721 RepID=G6EEW7_9SPHN|nr:hypothetical protein NSU_2888 [Novosphingobium pentaromativorans US6-1]
MRPWRIQLAAMTQSDTIAPRVKSEAANAVMTIFLSGPAPDPVRGQGCGQLVEITNLFYQCSLQPLFLFCSIQVKPVSACSAIGRLEHGAFRVALGSVN